MTALAQRAASDPSAVAVVPDIATLADLLPA